MPTPSTSVMHGPTSTATVPYPTQEDLAQQAAGSGGGGGGKKGGAGSASAAEAAALSFRIEKKKVLSAVLKNMGG